MEITHSDGSAVNTDKLPDVDAILMEASKNTHALFAQYNRQLLLVGEMKAKEETASREGCVFFHVGPKTMTPQECSKAMELFLARLDMYLRTLTMGQFGLGRIPPPQVPPVPADE